jgi:hypothetical protein
MSNDVIVFAVDVFCFFARRFLLNTTSLATYVEIDGITSALSVYAFILCRVCFKSRRNS